MASAGSRLIKDSGVWRRQQLFDLRKQHRQAHRFEQDGVCARRQQLFTASRMLHAGQRQHRDPEEIMLGAPVQKLQAVHDRHHRVQDDQMRRPVQQLLNRLLTIFGAAHLITRLSQDQSQQFADGLVIVDD